MLRNVVICVIPDVSKVLDPSKRWEPLKDIVSIPEDLNRLRCTDLLVYLTRFERLCFVFESAWFESGLTCGIS